MKNYLDGGEAILEAFRKLKIDYIMSSPGSEWSPLWEALARQKLDNKAGPTFVESWHETLAVNMATGYTLMTGRPQAVLLHAGVGMLQGSMGVHGALQNEVPMVVMSGESQTLGEDPDLDIEQQWYGGLTVGGIERFVEPVAKWARAVTSPHTLYESVVRAGEMAQRVPKGPIYLNVALEHMLHDWTPPAGSREVPAAPTLQPRQEDVAKVTELLLNAKNPVIVTETAGRDPKAFSALVELADLLAIPVINGRVNAYANFPTDHPLYQGMGNYKALDDADVILLVGGRAPWYPARRRPTNGKIIAVHDNPLKGHMVYQTLHADLYLEGDTAESLKLDQRSRKGGEGRRRGGECAPATLDARARELCGGPARRAREGSERKRDPPALAAGCSRGGDARRHDLYGRDHHALAPAAPAPAADHAAEFLPRLRRARPGDRHRARPQACRSHAAGGVAHRRRVVSLQPHRPGTRRLEAPCPADHDRHPQQQEIRGDAQGPCPSLSRWRVGQQRPALRRDNRRTRLRAIGKPFRLPRRAGRDCWPNSRELSRPRWPPPRPGRPRSSMCT